jgi:hypothetical protein
MCTEPDASTSLSATGREPATSGDTKAKIRSSNQPSGIEGLALKEERNPGRLAPPAHRAPIEQSNLVAPTIPSRPCLTCEEFEIRTCYKPLDPITYALWLTAVLSALFHNQAFHVLGSTRRLAARGEQALLRVGSRPVAEPREITRAVFGGSVELHPIETDGLVFKSPSLDKVESARQ